MTVATAAAREEASQHRAAEESMADQVRRLRDDDDAWDTFVADAATGSFPQLTAWAEANVGKGWRATRVVAESATGPVGAQLLVHRMRPGPWSRAYAPRGPIARELDQEAVLSFTRGLRAAAGRLRLSHALIDPEVERGGALEAWLAAAGWRSAGEIQINRTRVLDLRQPESALWSDLRSSARWSVNRARRAGFTVVEQGAEGLDDFERLYLETARRVGFTPSAAFRAVHAAFARRGAARLLIARGPGAEPAATLMLLDRGSRVVEYYGASTQAGAAARANYLIKWEAIRSSRERGMASYDMWGTDQAGLATFKASFGGREMTYVGAWELVTDPRAHALLRAVQAGRTGVSAAASRLRRLRAPAAPASTAAPASPAAPAGPAASAGLAADPGEDDA